jgi:hypothetical protein
MAERAKARRAAEPPVPDPHAGHHTHRRGNSLWCSCGDFGGVFTVALPEDGSVIPEDPPCQICATS